MIMSSVQEIARALEGQSGLRIVCIDGPAGAGKTTLSDELCREFPQAVVVHMDDLYDGWENALDERLMMRLVNSIIEPLRAGRPLQISKYNWHTHQFGEVIPLPYTDLVIIEGVGAAQTAMRDIATMTVWIDIDESTGKQRVLNRDGESVAPFIDQWQRDEKNHHEQHKTKASCHFVVTSS